MHRGGSLGFGNYENLRDHIQTSETTSDASLLSYVHRVQQLLAADRKCPGIRRGYVKRLSPDRPDMLATAVQRTYLAGAADGPRSMAATAWAARGQIP